MITFRGTVITWGWDTDNLGRVKHCDDLGRGGTVDNVITLEGGGGG